MIPTLVGQGRAATMSDLRRDASWLGPNCYPNVIHGSFQAILVYDDLHYPFEFIGDPGRT